MIDSYVGGSESRTSGVLTDIVTSAFSNTVSDYRLSYQAGTATGRIRLSSVTRCTSTSGSTCLLPTNFVWQDAVLPGCSSGSCPVTLDGANANGQVPGFKPILGNFDGSGRTSIAWVPEDQYGRTTAGTMYFWLAQPNGTFVEDQTTNAVKAGYRVYAGDFNGDGLTDLMFDAEYQNQDPSQGAVGSYGPVALWMNQGRSVWTQNGGQKFTISNTLTAHSQWSPMIGDFDGDGRSDVIWMPIDVNGHTNYGSQTTGTATIWSGFNNASGSWGYTSSTISDIPNGQQLYIVDMTGDGKTDLVFDAEDQYGCNDGSFQTQISNGLNSSGHLTFTQKYAKVNGATPSEPYIGGYRPFFGDFLGTGASSVYWVHVDNSAGSAHGIGASDGKSIVWFGNGDGTFHSATGPSSAYAIPTIADFNGDGKADILVNNESYNTNTGVDYYQSGGWTKLYTSNGDGTFTNSCLAPCNGASTSKTPMVADFNGDGKADVFWVNTYADGLVQSASQYALWQSDGVTPDLMTQFTSGFGEWSKIVYSQLSGVGSVYTVGSSAAYPNVDTDGPISVVSLVVADDGTGNPPAAIPSLVLCGPGGGEAGHPYTGLYASCYAYSGAVTNSAGRGFTGFSTMTVTDEETGVVQTTTYENGLVSAPEGGNLGFCISGMALSSTKTLNGVTLNSTQNSLHCNPVTYPNPQTSPLTNLTIGFPYVGQSVAKEYELNGGGLVKTTTTTTYYDQQTPGSGGFTATLLAGNATYVDTVVVDAAGGRSFDKAATNIYGDTSSSTAWCLSRLTGSTVTSNIVVNGTETNGVTRQSSFVYDPNTCLLTEETVEPEAQGQTNASGATNLYLDTVYQRDGFGNITQTTVKGDGVSGTRVTQTAWDTTYAHEFPASVTVVDGDSGAVANRTTTYTHEPAFGKVLSATDPNGLFVSTSYDGFGRTVSWTSPHVYGSSMGPGTETLVTYFMCSSLPSGLYTCPSNATYGVESETLGTDHTNQIDPISVAFFDGMARAVGSDAQSFTAGVWNRTATIYDHYGRVSTTSLPYRAGYDTAQTTSYAYDAIGRQISVTAPNLCTITTAYSMTSAGFQELVTSCANANLLYETRTTVKDAMGQVISVTDANSNSSSYSYDALGEMLSVTDPAHNVVSFTYDTRGRKLTETNPDTGFKWWSYDALGQVLTSSQSATVQATTPANTQTYIKDTYAYDNLGRVTTRTDGDGLTTYWYYDTASGGGNTGSCLGLPAWSWDTSGAQTNYSYDGWCREVGRALEWSGQTQTYTTSYDPQTTKVATITYPDTLKVTTSYGCLAVYNGSTTCLSPNNGVTPGYVIGASVKTPGATSASGFASIYAEDAMNHVTDSATGDGVITLGTFDPQTGHLTQIQTGDYCGAGCTVQPTVQNLAYGYDNLGNVTSRYDGVNGTNETFAYDTMNQLASVAVTTGASSGSEAYIYDAVGNMTFRSNLGTMTYGPGGAGGVPAGKIGPHQLASMRVDHQNSPYYPAFAGMSGSTSTCTTQTGNSIYRCYAYWNAGMVSTVTERTNQLSYTYDEARRRVHSHELVNNVKTEETWYLWGPAGVFSHQQQNMDPTGQNVVSTEWHDYIQLGGRLVGEYASTTSSSGTTASTYYFHTDAQGSVTAITGGGAVVVEQDSYDAWGKQRQTNGAIDTGAGGNAHSGATCALAATDVQNRGWIGQESLGRRGVCLSDLNARLYDSLTASFVQPDQVVGQPFSTHGWNAYAYAGNNPMTFSDPTGMCFAGCAWKSSLFRDVAALAAAAVIGLEVLPAAEGFATAQAAAEAGYGGLNAGIAGAVHGAISTGTLKGTLLSTGQALAFNAVGWFDTHVLDVGEGSLGSIAMHGLAGGLFSVAGGGKFQSGFLAAGFAELAGPHLEIDGNGTGALAANTAINAVTGGIGSVLGGGKFENGAVTGAFGYLFNHVYHLSLNGQSKTLMYCEDCGGSSRPYEVFSGLGDCRNDPSCVSKVDMGPIPPGTYYIVQHGTGTLGWLWDDVRAFIGYSRQANWFELWSADTNSDHLSVDGVTRGAFRLHPEGPMGISEGCVTICKGTDPNFDSLRQQLLSTPMGKVPGTDTVYYGKLYVTAPSGK